MYTDNTDILLDNVEIAEDCKFNIKTGKKVFVKYSKKNPPSIGSYFRDNNTFFAIYPTKRGVMMYYNNKEYPLKKDLHIKLNKSDKHREFIIEEYDIKIQYEESVYMNFDPWSTEMDVDLFYRIAETYKDIVSMEYNYEENWDNNDIYERWSYKWARIWNMKIQEQEDKI